MRELRGRRLDAGALRGGALRAGALRAGSLRAGSLRADGRLRRSAPVFAALADPTRLALVTRLGAGRRLSISRLTEGSGVTRQAITKHLRVLQESGLVRAVRRGRESLYTLDSAPVDRARAALDRISREWDQALARLRVFVER